MADIRTFVQGGLRIELCDIEAAVPLERIDRQVTYPERGEILEKVRALARFDTEIIQPALDDHFRL